MDEVQLFVFYVIRCGSLIVELYRLKLEIISDFKGIIG